ncbi:hypothetical protein WDW86_05050 [Bdellovibrionota bacterium FG-2]
MNFYQSAVFVLVMGLCLQHKAIAKTIYYGSETEVVSLVAGGPTLFRFPSEVKTISQSKRFTIAPATHDQPNYALLSVQPRVGSGGSSVVTFILSDGTIIKVKLVVVSAAIPEKTDSVYEFKSKESLLPQSGAGSPGSGVSELELMKAMLRGDEVAGYEVRNLTRTLIPGFKGVTTKLLRVYTGNQFNGYIFELHNKTRDQSLYINTQNLMLGDPNLAILSSVDQAVIEPKGETYLRIVAKPTSSYNQLILPVETITVRGGVSESERR